MSANDFSDTKPVGLYESAIGQKNQDYYLNKFEDFDDKGPGAHLSWNWAAFVGVGAWALYRKMYGWFFAWWAVVTVVTVYAKVPNDQIHQFLAIGLGVFWLGFAMFANSLYHRKIKARITSAQSPNSDASRVSRRLSASGGVHTWVPIVFGAIPVIGIAAAVALPAYQDYTKRQSSPIAQANSNEKSAASGLQPFYGKLDSESPAVYAKQTTFQEALAADKSGDYSAALRLYAIAAGQGDGEAQTNLGSMYENGRGVLQNYSEAAKWYRLAAPQGIAVAQFNLGSIYDAGQGVSQDSDEAVKWYRMAAKQGYANAQSNLGMMYARGRGVRQDVVRAHMWFNLGSVSGNSYAQKNRDIATATMTPQQIAQAQQMARDCQQHDFKECE